MGILINQSKMLEKKILDKYKAINLLERYKSLSDTFNSKEILEKYDRKQVLTHLKEKNCRFIYNTKEGFFGLKEQEGDYDFIFNISLQYGMVEPIIWGKNVCTNEQFGGVLVRVTKLMQISMGVKKIERIRDPRYASYDDLFRIIEQLFSIYLDFKQVILSDE